LQLSQQNYRLLALYYLGIAKVCTDPELADRYRGIAADYFDRAAQTGQVFQQQQVQRDERAE
jgi:hypothetical protein